MPANKLVFSAVKLFQSCTFDDLIYLAQSIRDKGLSWIHTCQGLDVQQMASLRLVVKDSWLTPISEFKYFEEEELMKLLDDTFDYHIKFELNEERLNKMWERCQEIDILLMTDPKFVSGFGYRKEHERAKKSIKFGLHRIALSRELKKFSY